MVCEGRRIALDLESLFFTRDRPQSKSQRCRSRVFGCRPVACRAAPVAANRFAVGIVPLMHDFSAGPVPHKNDRLGAFASGADFVIGSHCMGMK